MAWIESPYRKKRTRYYNNKKAELERLNAKWTNEFRKLGFGNALDRASTAYQGGRTNGMLLSYYEIHNPAWNYAENKAESSLTWYQSLVSGNGGVAILSFVIAVVTAVASFFCPPFAPFGITLFGGLSGVGLTAAIVSATAAYIGVSAAMYHSYKASGLGGLAMFVQSKTAFLREKSTKEQQSYALTNMMIYGEYAIYANGSIYNQGAAGAGQNFSPTIAFDPTKGLRGDIQRDGLDEQIMGRVGGDLAGGQNFHSNIMNLDIPLAKFELDINKVQETLFQRYYKIQKLIASAFSELADAAFNADGNAQRVYNVVAENLTDGTKKNLYDTDFLNKMKNYNRNLRADFDYFFKSKFERKKAASSWENAISGESFLEVMQSAEIDGKKKAQIYVEKICEILDIIRDMQNDGSTYGTWGWIKPYYFYPACDWENVIYRRSKTYKNAGRNSEKAINEIAYKGILNDILGVGILKAGVFMIEYYKINKKYKGDELLELLKTYIISNLGVRDGRFGFYYNANVLRGEMINDYNKVWRYIEYQYDVYAYWRYKETLYNYQCFANLGKESYEFLQEFYEIGQSPMIQNYLQGIEIEVFNDPNNEQLDFGENNNK